MTEEGNMSQWIQDNLRIIISTGIVILLVFAIYSYSKRNSRIDVVVDDSQIEEVTANGDSSNDNEINKIIAEINDEDKTSVPSASDTSAHENEKANTIAAQKAENERIAQERAAQEKREAEQRAAEEARIAMEKQQAEQKAAAEKKAAEDAAAKQPARDVVQEIIASQTQQKDGVVAVTAIHGDSATTLARKALAEYMTKNNISELTGAHKIYIEDYLRKHNNIARVYPGTEMQFTNTLIDQAIAQSRTLTEAQLAHLDTYARRVKNL